MSDDKKKANAAPADDSPEAAAKSKKKKMIIIAALGALLVLGGGGGAFVFLSKGKKAHKEEEITKEDPHGEAKKDEHGDGHGEAKKDEHGEAKDEHGEAKKDEHGEAKKDDKAKEEDKSASNIDFGETYKMQTFNLNLGNALENRYLRIEISLEYRGGGEQKKEIEKRLPQLRDAIIGILQRKTREFLLSPDGKESLRKELLIRINRYMTKKIESVYITDLLIE